MLTSAVKILIRKLLAGWQKNSKRIGIDVRKDPLALQRLDEAAEKAKIELSTAVQTEVNIPFITSDSSGPKHLVLTMTRAKLEELTQEFIDRAMEITKRAMEASPFKKAEINEIVLVGGQTRMPAMQKAVKDFFGKELHMGVNPMKLWQSVQRFKVELLRRCQKIFCCSMLFHFRLVSKLWEALQQNY
jgi:molecular chaperone DnaK (HSP70)